MSGAQRFATWLDDQPITQRKIAKQLGCSEATVSRIRNADRRPGRKLAVLIERITNRHVRVEDWDLEVNE